MFILSGTAVGSASKDHFSRLANVGVGSE